MGMKFNSRSDQVRERNNLERQGVMAQTDQQRMRLDTERLEQQIRMMNVDGTQEDDQAVLQGIAQVQSQVRNKMNQVLENSQQVTQEMVRFEQGAEAATERARQDAERMAAVKSQLHNRNDLESQVEHIRGQKQDSRTFQNGQHQQMKTADDELQRVIESTKQAVQNALNRTWK
jgi:hypothetical protein